MRGENQRKGSDIQAEVRDILRTGRVLEVDAVGPDEGVLDGGEAAVLVKGDLTAGAILRGAGSLVVEGSVMGGSNRTCQIDMGGEVVILGSVRQADIRAQRIRIGKWASKCLFTTEVELEVDGDLVDARIVSGEMGRKVEEIQRLRHKLTQAGKEQGFIEQQVKLDQKRMDKLFQATRVSFDFNIGQIIKRSSNRLEVDLHPFYKVVGEKSEEEIDRALLEFFARAVVGLMTRVNRNFIMGGSNNRKIFTTVVRKLHDLTFLTRKLDKQMGKIRRDEAELKRMVEALSGRRSTVSVRGAVLSDAELRFVLPEVTYGDDGEISIAHRTTELILRKGAGADQREVVRIDAGGEDVVEVFSPGELEDIQFQVEDETIVWEKRETTVR